MLTIFLALKTERVCRSPDCFCRLSQCDMLSFALSLRRHTTEKGEVDGLGTSFADQRLLCILVLADRANYYYWCYSSVFLLQWQDQ